MRIVTLTLYLYTSSQVQNRKVPYTSWSLELYLNAPMILELAVELGLDTEFYLLLFHSSINSTLNCTNQRTCMNTTGSSAVQHKLQTSAQLYCKPDLRK